MSYRDVRILLAKASELITVLGIKPSEVTRVSFSGLIAEKRRLIGLPAPKVIDV